MAVLWVGGAGLETVDALAPYANYVHVYQGRTARQLPRGADDVGIPGSATASTPDPHTFLSWESRYVGNVRAINAGLMDAYLLKSLDGGLPFAYWDGLMMVRCGENR